MRTVGAGVLIGLAALLVACPSTTKLSLRNDSSSEIEVISAYSDAVLASIAPGESETVLYGQDCLRIEARGRLFEFPPALPPDGYTKVGTFGVRIFAVFTPEEQLELTHPAGQTLERRNFTVEPGC